MRNYLSTCVRTQLTKRRSSRQTHFVLSSLWMGYRRNVSRTMSMAERRYGVPAWPTGGLYLSLTMSRTINK